MKMYGLLGVVFGLVGCLGAEEIEGELGEEKIGEASGAISGLISPFANNTTYKLTQTQLDGQIRTGVSCLPRRELALGLIKSSGGCSFRAIHCPWVR